VDTQGFLLSAEISAANKNDREGLKNILDKIKGSYRHLKLFFADMGYLGQKTLTMVRAYGRDLEIVMRPPKWFWIPDAIKDVNAFLKSHGIEVPSGFKVLPKRWIVERTFAWFNKFRRLSKDYEYLVDTSEATLWLAMSRIILKRLSKMDLHQV
jgi:putative transposase